MTVEAFMARADADRQQREQAREDFVAWLRSQKGATDWGYVVTHLGWTFNHGAVTTIERALADFAAAHGWPDTLRAVAQAMDADERERRELVDRR